jgi:hypothetical protein
MKKLLFIMLLAASSFESFAQKQDANKIIGIWESVDSDVQLKFDIYQSGDKYFGKLL